MWVSNQAFYGNTIWDMIRGLKPTILWVVIRNDLLEYLWFLHVLMGLSNKQLCCLDGNKGGYEPSRMGIKLFRLGYSK